MKVVERKISELKAADYNPRVLTAEAHEHLKNSLSVFGLVDPIIVNKHKTRNDIIVGGHKRLQVWEELGNKTVPTVEVKLTLKRERELNVRLNKNTGDWDWEKLVSEFSPNELIEFGFDEWEIPTGDVDLDDLFEQQDEDKAPSNKIVLEYNEEDFVKVNERFNELDGSKEDIIYNFLFDS